jgi:hypothetical protein
MPKRVILLFIFFIGQLSVIGQDFSAGAATRTINPEKDSLFIAGGKPNRPFIDVHDNLYVKAVVISNPKNNITLLTFDCIGLLYPQLQAIRSRIKIELPFVDPEHIVMSSTHTHSGPDVVGIWGKDLMHSGVNDKHMQLIVDRAVEAIKEAVQVRKPVNISYGSGSFGEDWVKNISEPGEIDRSVSVIKFTALNGKNIAMLTNFACHPTIMDDKSTAASSDYVWGYYHYLDSIQGGVNMFLQGAIGGWVQPEDVPHTYDDAKYYGSSLGKYAFELTKKKTSSKNIYFTSAKVNFPLANPSFQMLSKMGTIKRTFGETVASEIAFFSIGDASFATHPGETCPSLSFDTKKLMKNKGPKFILGLSQDALGYIIKPSFFDASNKIPHSEYLTGMSIGSETMGIILSTLKNLIKNTPL